MRYCEYCGRKCDVTSDYGCCYFVAEGGCGFTEPVEVPMFQSLSKTTRALIALLEEQFFGVATERQVIANLDWLTLDTIRSLCHPMPKTNPETRGEASVPADGPWPDDNRGALLLLKPCYQGDVVVLVLTELGRASWRTR